MRVQKFRDPDYLEYSSTISCSCTGAEISERSEISAPVQEQLIVELYSK